MELALACARRAARVGEVPIGAVVTRRGAVIAAAHNLTETLGDSNAHAEILAIRQAARHCCSRYLLDCDLYVTLEPCAMCAQAISHARIARLYFAAEDPKGGAVDHGPKLFSQPTCFHRPDIYSGLSERHAADLLRGFFRSRRS